MSYIEIEISDLKKDVGRISKRIETLEEVMYKSKAPTSILDFQVGDYLLFDHLIQHGPQIVSQISTDMGVAYVLIGIKSGNRYYNAVKTLEELNGKITESIENGAEIRKISREELKNLL